jgi:hypothetical protein
MPESRIQKIINKSGRSLSTAGKFIFILLKQFTPLRFRGSGVYYAVGVGSFHQSLDPALAEKRTNNLIFHVCHYFGRLDNPVQLIYIK